MAHFEIYLESSGNIFAGGADLISISDFLSRELCVTLPRADLYMWHAKFPKMSCHNHTGSQYMKKV